jgi:hypothetical protein
MNEDSDLAPMQAERLRRGGVEDGFDLLYLDEVIPRAERADLARATQARALGHGVRACVRQAAIRLGVREIALGTDPALAHEHPRALGEQAVEIGSREVEIAAPAGSGWNRTGDLVDERLEAVAEVVRVVRQSEEPHAAVDVVADAAGRDGAVGELHRGDTTHGEPVPLMDVRHGERCAHDPGERGYVLKLLQRPIATHRLEQLAVGEDPRGDAHVRSRLSGNLPEGFIDAYEFGRRQRVHANNLARTGREGIGGATDSREQIAAKLFMWAKRGRGAAPSTRRPVRTPAGLRRC